VSTRSVDPGQTVAASFQTPTLFLIANDLTHMRVMADVDEANIGKLREGMVANARVDAFPREMFRGTVSSLRIAPTTTSGVVTYATVIDVANPERKLRPGMTATITVNTQHRDDVLRVPNAALRYHPAPPPGSPGRGGAAGGAGGSGHGGGGGAAVGGRVRSALAGGDVNPDAGTIYVLRNGTAVRIPVTVGITDGVSTEVSAPPLHDGDEVVLDETDASGAPRSGAPRMRMF
jgi:HlyD family secretion protein